MTRDGAGRVAATVLLLGLFYMDPDPNQVTKRYLAQAISLWNEGSLFVPESLWRPEGDFIRLPDGGVIPVSQPGTAILLAPVAGPAWNLLEGSWGDAPEDLRWAVVAALSLAVVLLPIAAVAAYGLSRLLERAVGRGPSILLTLVLFLGTPLFYLTARVYDYAPSVLLLLAAWLAVESASERSDARTVFVGGVAAGLSLLFNYTALWPALALAVSAPALLGGRRAGWFLGGMAVGLLPLLVIQWRILGSPLRTPHHVDMRLTDDVRVFHPAWFRAYEWKDLTEASWGVTFGMKGLFWYVPVAWVLLPAACAGLRGEGIEGWRARLGLTAFCLLFAFNLCLRHGLWVGGSGFGPRQLTLAWPFLVVGAAAPAARWLAGRGGVFVRALAAWSIFIGWLGAQLGHADSLLRHLVYFVISGPTSPLYRYLDHYGAPFLAEHLAATGANPNPYAHYHALTHISSLGGYLLLMAALWIVWRGVPRLSPPPAS